MLAFAEFPGLRSCGQSRTRFRSDHTCLAVSSTLADLNDTDLASVSNSAEISGQGHKLADCRKPSSGAELRRVLLFFSWVLTVSQSKPNQQ